MQVSELYQLTDWIEENIKDGDVLPAYLEVHNALAERLTPPDRGQKERLFMALRRVPLGLLNKTQLQVLHTMGIGEHVGADSVESVRKILDMGLFYNREDMSSQIKGKISDIQTGIRKSDDIRAGLSKSNVPDEDWGEDKVLVRVIFSNDVNISNVVDLKEWSARWHDIARGITIIHDKSPEEFEVVGAKKGSLIFELLLSLTMAGIAVDIVRRATEAAKNYAQAKYLAQKTRALKLQNRDQIAKLMESDREKKKEEEIKAITSETMNAVQEKDGEKGNALRTSVANLVDFLSKGGEIDWVIPDETDAPKQNVNQDVLEARRKLRETVQEIRRLNADPRRLEHHPDHDEDDRGENGDGDGKNGDTAQ